MNISGGEYLVAFYKRISPRQLQASGFRETRYRFPPVLTSKEQVYSAYSGPRGISLTLPGFAGPPGGRVIPIAATGSGDHPAVALIYLNAPLVALLQTASPGAANPVAR